MPNNRQLASVLLLALFAAWVLTRGDLRQGVGSILRSLGDPKLLVPILLFVGYVAGLVLAGQRADLWDAELATDTVFCFAGTAFVLFVNMNKVAEEKHYVRRTALKTVRLTVFLEFVVNLFVLPLWAELLVQPVLIVLTSMAVVAGTKDELASVGKAVGCLLTSAVLALLVYAFARLAMDWSHIAWAHDAREFALPIWLTIGLLPALLVTSLAANYELAWVGLTFATDDRRTRRRSFAAVFLVLRGRTRDLAQFAGGWPDRVAETDSLRHAMLVVRNFRRSLRSATAAEATRLRNLRDYAGVDGEDERGARLDRREFRERKRRCDGSPFARWASTTTAAVATGPICSTWSSPRNSALTPVNCRPMGFPARRRGGGPGRSASTHRTGTTRRTKPACPTSHPKVILTSRPDRASIDPPRDTGTPRTT